MQTLPSVAEPRFRNTFKTFMFFKLLFNCLHLFQVVRREKKEGRKHGKDSTAIHKHLHSTSPLST